MDSTSTDKWSQHDKRLLLLERDDEGSLPTAGRLSLTLFFLYVAIKLFGSVIAVSLYMILFLHLAIITGICMLLYLHNVLILFFVL